MPGYSLTSLLINNQCISMARWPDSVQRGLDSLIQQGIIRKVENRKVYLVTSRYRPALEELKKLGCFPILKEKETPKREVRVGHQVCRKRRRVTPLPE